MSKQAQHSLNYYFLNKTINVKKQAGYRQTILNFIVNKDKFLFVQERGGFWGFTRQSVVDQDIIENLFETMVRNLGEELGFKGLKIKEFSPRFTPRAYLFNFDKQTYDEKRAEAEKRKNRHTKGKIYHLAMIEYKGPLELPIETNDLQNNIKDYKWVDIKVGRELTTKNRELAKKNFTYSEESMKYHESLYERIIKAYELIETSYNYQPENKMPLFD